MHHSIKIEFKNYPSGSYADWSSYLVTASQISRRVESENEGEAGLIVFDNTSLAFYYEPGNPVYAAFEIDLTAVQRYLFRLSKKKESDLSYVILFEGVADFSTITWPELGKQISFEVVDKLSALAMLAPLQARTKGNILYDVNTNPGVTKIAYRKYWDFFDIEMRYVLPLDTLTNVENTPDIGDIIQINFLPNTPKECLGLVVFKWYDDFITGRVVLGIITNYQDEYQVDTTDFEGGEEPLDTAVVDNSDWYSKLYNGENIYLSRERTDYYLRILGEGVAGTEIYAIDGIKLVETIVKGTWPEVTIINRMGTATFPIPPDYFADLITENPFNTTPFDALKNIAATINCYIFFDRLGRLVIQKKGDLGTQGTQRSLTGLIKLDGEKKYFWDKLADSVKVTVKSFFKNSDHEQIEAVQAVSNVSKPRNEMNVELYYPELAAPANIEEALNQYALDKANEYFSFYGKRHWSLPFTFDLSDTILEWDLLDYFIESTNKYFITALEYNLENDSLSVEFVSVAGYAFDPRAIIVGLSGNEGSGSSYAAAYSLPGSQSPVETRMTFSGTTGIGSPAAIPTIKINTMENVNCGVLCEIKIVYLSGYYGNNNLCYEAFARAGNSNSAIYSSAGIISGESDAQDPEGSYKPTIAWTGSGSEKTLTITFPLNLSNYKIFINYSAWRCTPNR